MTRSILGCALLLALGGTAGAQVPIAPPPAPVAPVAAAPAAAEPKTIWGFFGLSCDKLRECHRKCCQTPIGQLFNSMLAPARLATGGLVPEWCPTVLSAEELAKLVPGEVSPAEAAAAKIKADEAGAKARRAAVKYLGTVDCHYYPEAELALIAALRANRNECVRLDAAWVLGRGCCCTKRTIEALNIVITGSDKDGNPVETSERVKICAMESIQNCMSRGVQAPAPEPPELPPPQPPEVPASLSFEESSIRLASHTLSPVPSRPVASSPTEVATRLIAESVSSQPPRALRTGSRSLLQIVSFTTRPAPEEFAPAHVAVPPSPAATLAPPLASPPPTAPPPARRVNLQPIGLAPINVLP